MSASKSKLLSLAEFPTGILFHHDKGTYHFIAFVFVFCCVYVALAFFLSFHVMLSYAHSFVRSFVRSFVSSLIQLFFYLFPYPPRTEYMQQMVDHEVQPYNYHMYVRTKQKMNSNFLFHFTPQCSNFFKSESKFYTPHGFFRSLRRKKWKYFFTPLIIEISSDLLGQNNSVIFLSPF
jgi:hypothetical protein